MSEPITVGGVLIVVGIVVGFIVLCAIGFAIVSFIGSGWNH